MTLAANELKPVRTRGAKRARLGIDVPMTYEEYLAGPEEMARYDIIDGLKIYYRWGIKQVPSPTRDHQEVLLNIAESMRAFQRASSLGRTLVAPTDVLIRHAPLRIRQPDVLFISNERWALNSSPKLPGVLDPAPDIVVEILSPSDTRRVRLSKVADYRSVGVRECWLVSLEAETIEMLRLTMTSIESVGVSGRGSILESVAFPGLVVAVDDVFANAG